MNEKHYMAIIMILVSFMVILSMITILFALDTTTKIIMLVLILVILIANTILLLGIYKDLIDVNAIVKKFRADRSLRLSDGGMLPQSKKNINTLLSELDNDEIQISLQEIKDSITANKIICYGILDGNVYNNHETTRKILKNLDKSSQSLKLIEQGQNKTDETSSEQRCYLIQEIMELSSEAIIPDVSIILDLPYSNDGITALVPETQIAKAFHSVLSSVSGINDFEELEIGISSVVNMRGHFSNAKLAIACKTPEQKPHVSTVMKRNAKRFLKWTYESDIILDKIIANENGMLVTFYIPISPQIKLKETE